MQLRFMLQGILEDAEHKCRITRTLLSRERGSSFDLWLKLQAPPYPSKEETEYMKKQSVPLPAMEILEAADPLVLDVSLLPLEMELIQIEIIN